MQYLERYQRKRQCENDSESQISKTVIITSIEENQVEQYQGIPVVGLFEDKGQILLKGKRKDKEEQIKMKFHIIN